MTVTRVRYREQQRLRSSDLQDEQAHRIAIRRRHNIAQHDWGIVRGPLTCSAGTPSRSRWSQ